MCGAIRFAGLEADGAPGVAAQGHRRALTGLLPAIRAIAARLAAMGLFNQVWLPQMRDAGASGGLGPVGFLAMLALYVIVAYGLMNASFKLIDLLPSAVLDWIGGRAGAGEDGSERTGGAAVAGISRMGAVRIGARSRRGGAGS